MNNDIAVRDAVTESDGRTIKIHGPEHAEGMRRAGKLAAETLDVVTPHVKPGVRTGELDDICREFIERHGAVPAPLGYRGFPRSICTSVNHVVCHGIPGAPIPRADPDAIKRAAKSLSPRRRAEGEHAAYHLTRDDDRLLEGDVVNIDVTVILDGWHGDTSRMFPVGAIDPEAARLIDATHESMMRGIAAIRPGATLRDLAAAVQSHAEGQRFAVVRDFCGHGLGRIFHDAPSILHYVDPRNPLMRVPLRPGMFFTVEPMINAGTWRTRLLDDGWTAVTTDLRLSAQFEHSVGVTEDGVEIFTLSPSGLHRPPYST
jgi:methionyl aminopeptidase